MFLIFSLKLSDDKLVINALYIGISLNKNKIPDKSEIRKMQGKL